MLLFEECQLDGRPVLPMFEPPATLTKEVGLESPEGMMMVAKCFAEGRDVPTGALRFHFPKGATHPFEATRLKKPLSLEAIVTLLPGGRRRVKVEGCFPPDGFTVGPETFERIYSPYIIA